VRTPTLIGGLHADVTSHSGTRTQPVSTPTLIGGLRAHVATHSTTRTTRRAPVV